MSYFVLSSISKYTLRQRMSFGSCRIALPSIGRGRKRTNPSQPLKSDLMETAGADPIPSVLTAVRRPHPFLFLLATARPSQWRRGPIGKPSSTPASAGSLSSHGRHRHFAVDPDLRMEGLSPFAPISCEPPRLCVLIVVTQSELLCRFLHGPDHPGGTDLVRRRNRQIAMTGGPVALPQAVAGSSPSYRAKPLSLADIAPRS